MRLIDCEKIQKPIYAEDDNITGIGMTYEEMEVYNAVVDKFWDRIKNAPTVDAVPVVRCKDCKYWEVIETIIGFDFVCTAQGDMNVSKDADDFCSWGERKEDE